MVSKCIFCAIIAGQTPSTKVVENENILVIKDISPKAPIHYLIIPKKHIADIQSFDPEDTLLAGQMIMMAHELAKKLPEPGAFRLVVNSGADAGQCVFHVHMHFLAGKEIPMF